MTEEESRTELWESFFYFNEIIKLIKFHTNTMIVIDYDVTASYGIHGIWMERTQRKCNHFAKVEN